MALNLFKKKPKAEAASADASAEDASPPADGADGAPAEAPKKKGPPLMLIVAGAAAGVLVVGGGGAAYLAMGSKLMGPADAHAGKAHKKKDGKKDDKPKAAGPNDPVITDGPNGVVFYTLPDMVVNMQTAEGKPTYLKLKLTLELPDHDTADVLEPNRPRLQDMFQTFLRELRPEDLAGSQGSYQLRMELLRRVNLVIAPAKINSVLIEEMLIT
jgi:flagellar FliL protein